MNKGKYHEPWTGFDTNNLIQMYPKCEKRAEACVNALAGCPNPQKFIDEVSKVLEFEGVDTTGYPEFAWLKMVSK